MFQKALIMMLHNAITNRYHPIFYLESPLPGSSTDHDLIRYKSKGHHTDGFDSLEEATKEVYESEAKLRSLDYTVKVELDPLLIWNDTEIPIDTQLR